MRSSDCQRGGTCGVPPRMIGTQTRAIASLNLHKLIRLGGRYALKKIVGKYVDMIIYD